MQDDTSNPQDPGDDQRSCDAPAPSCHPEPCYQIEVSRRAPAGEVDDGRLLRALELALRRQGCGRARLEVALVDDAEIARLHERYLRQAGPTDVLSFDLSEPGQEGLDGQVVVSVETARREARRRDHGVEAEVVLYGLHGTLHLLGYDDATPDQAERMHRMEDELLTELGFGAVYGVRSS